MITVNKVISGYEYGTDPVEVKPQVELKGLSTDEKPTDCGVNSLFWELDTGDFYYFDGTEWNAITNSGGGGGMSDFSIANVEVNLSGLNGGDMLFIPRILEEEGEQEALVPFVYAGVVDEIKVALYKGRAFGVPFIADPTGIEISVDGNVEMVSSYILVTGDGSISITGHSE